MKKKILLALLVLAVLSTPLLFAGGGKEEEAPAALETAAPVSAEKLEEFNAKIDQLFQEYTGPMTSRPPAAGPEAVKGKKRLAYVGIFMASEACLNQDIAFKKATDILGWQYISFDAKADPVILNEVLQKAVAWDPDVITGLILHPIWGAEGYRFAKDAGIPVVTVATWEEANNPGILASNVDGDTLQRQELAGYLTGVAAYKLGKGKAHIIAIASEPSDTIAHMRLMGLQKFVEESKAAGGDCELWFRQMPAAQFGEKSAPTAASLAQAHPSFNVVWGVGDFIAILAGDGLRSAGLMRPDVIGIGIDGNRETLDLIRQGGFMAASLGFPWYTAAWAQVDDANRILSGEEPIGIEHGFDMRLLWKGNLPPEGEDKTWDALQFDPESFYRKLWGK